MPNSAYIQKAARAMVIIKILGGVTEHFPARRSEWVLSGMMVAWGLLLIKPSDIFNQSAAWAPLSIWAPEPVWGWAAIAIGTFRLIALLINGTFYKTWYGRYSPHVRMTASFLMVFIWTQISWGLYNSPIETTGVSIYPGLLVLDFMNIIAAASDAGKMDKARKDGY